MGMAASSLRLTSLAARKNQVEFEGQQINQQRVVLSQKSSAVYNQMLEMQVPTAPDPSNYTKIVYKFNAGNGESQIINMAKKASGPYNYSIKYKSPATEKVLSRSTYNNVSFAKPTDKIGNDKFQYLNSNINGNFHEMELVGGSDSAKLLSVYKNNLSVYSNMKTIEAQIAALSAKGQGSDKVSSSTQRDIAAALGISDTTSAGTEALKKYMRPKSGLLLAKMAEATQDPNNPAVYTENNILAGIAYDLPLDDGHGNNDSKTLKQRLEEYNSANSTSYTLNNLAEMLNAVEGHKDNLNLTSTDLENINSIDDLAGLVYGNLNDFPRSTMLDELFKMSNFNPLFSASEAATSLYNAGTGEGAINTNITNDDMIAMLQGMLKSISITSDNANGYSTSSEYNLAVVTPSYTQYANSASVPGMTNVDKNQALYQYTDAKGDKAYMYVSLDNLSDTYQNSYADSVNVYENALSYVDGRTEINEQDANIVLSSDGQITKITFADGTMVQPTVTTEMDQDAYDFAMVEYEYKKDVYEKAMNDANAKIKVIQAQDQKLEVRLKQLDTEQKALSTEIDAVKSVRDKSIEGSFKTFA